MILDAFGRISSVIRGIPDRLLHRQRYSDAVRRLERMAFPRTVLVVCHGNICRSPYLEAVLKRALPNVTVTSAGFVGQGREVPPHSLSVAAERGLDLSRFRSRPLVPATARNVDLVIVMDRRQAAYVTGHFGIPPGRIVIAGDLDPRPGSPRVIEDPWQRPREVFVTSFDRLDRCAATLARHLARLGA
jgi:protein-tyrosine phosphatase